jgi:hypothetical protein
MPDDVADAVLDKVKHFTVGFGRAGDTPAAKGTGVLIKHGELHGILTCAHVAKHLKELKQPVGIVRLNRGLAQQFGTLNMDEIFSYAAGEELGPRETMTFPSFTYRRTSSETLQRTPFFSTSRRTSRRPNPTIGRR